MKLYNILSYTYSDFCENKYLFLNNGFHLFVMNSEWQNIKRW